MRPSVTLFTLLAFALQSAMAETPGLCTVSHVVEKNRYVMDRIKKAWNFETYNETVQREECCAGYRAEMWRPLSCTPVCDPPCENSDCMAPDTCVCHPGHVMINNSNSTCYEVCDSCVNGACLSPEDAECTCAHGYSRDLRFPHICDPVCAPGCINATCVAPSLCECYRGYKPLPDANLGHICVPHCSKDCVFGACVEPEVCSCFDGFINDKDAPSICLPVCNRTCENGYCAGPPDLCRCHDGFQLHPRDPFQCVPRTPEHSSLNYCELVMPQAIKYDRDSDCFLLKEKITISVSPDCRVIESQSGSFCSRRDNCHHNECVLNFRCSAKKFNGSYEVHCNLEQEDFETDSTNVDRITNATEWTDVVLVVNSYQHFNSSVDVKQNVTKEWTLRPLSKGLICGKMHFAVELSECEAPITMSQANDHINSSFMFWLNVFLISGFLLMVGAGVGGFLWARHRRLNDPLNYREDMIQGYYNNECYDNTPAEIVSDDDSDRYSDAPL